MLYSIHTGTQKMNDELFHELKKAEGSIKWLEGNIIRVRKKNLTDDTLDKLIAYLSKKYPDYRFYHYTKTQIKFEDKNSIIERLNELSRMGYTNKAQHILVPKALFEALGIEEETWHKEDEPNT